MALAQHALTTEAWNNPQPGDRVTIYSTECIIINVEPLAHDAHGKPYVKYIARPAGPSMPGAFRVTRYLKGTTNEQ